VIKVMLEGFPFTISGFHADNGSEYIHHQIARVLEKIRIEFAQSRPRHSNENGLAETKNGGVVRKCFGYRHPRSVMRCKSTAQRSQRAPLSIHPSPIPARCLMPQVSPSFRLKPLLELTESHR